VVVSPGPIIERVYIQRIQQDNKVTDYLTECKMLLLGVLVEMSSHPEKLPAYIYGLPHHRLPDPKPITNVVSFSLSATTQLLILRMHALE